MRKVRLFLLAGCAAAACAALGVALGAGRLDWPGLFSALRTGAETPDLRILLHVRLPRVAGALLAGVGLATSGVILQAVLENPLASPNVIGVNGGAGFLILLVSSLLPGRPALLVPAAFAGALLGAGVVLAISLRTACSPVSVVLSGFVVGSMFTAGMNIILLVDPDAYVGAGSFLAGGLSGLTLGELRTPALYLLPAFAAALLLSRQLNILSLGPDAASALGMRTAPYRAVLLVTAAVLAGAAVSFAGMVGFVGLAAPHAARMLIGQDNRLVIPLSALLGASLVTLCDTLARVLFAPFELPVGILLSFVGGPVFIHLILKNRRHAHD